MEEIQALLKQMAISITIITMEYKTKKKLSVLLGVLIAINLFPGISTIDEMMKDVTIENCWKAIKEYEKLLQIEPDNYEILCKIATAYIHILDIKTSALRVEKKEFLPILKKLGGIANNYAERAYKLKPHYKEVISVNLVSYGYYMSSFGLAKIIFKGAVGHYKALCHQLIKTDDTFLGALGYSSLGKLYLAAPWPVGNEKKALEFFKKAVEIDGTVLYSRYYLGLIHYNKKQFSLAEKQFAYVLENDPCYHEKHFIDDFKKMARYYSRRLSRLKKK